MKFVPCQGKQACRDDGEKCLTCGRTLEEIYRLRDILDQLAGLAIAHEYQNTEEFAQYVAVKLPRMVAHRLAKADEMAPTVREVVHAD